ncbi:MAG: glycogen synthase GlgA [Magnetococcales bacterium]|nr:glycogen synthase GlgA [Magnetococcales bacterium]
MKILHLCSEAFPLIKTGGLGDVAGALPSALAGLGVDAQVMMPAYSGLKQKMRYPRKPISLGNLLGSGNVNLIRGRMPDSGVVVWLVDCPALYQRDGGPYQDESGQEWPDNAQRFALLSLAGAVLVEFGTLLGWQPDILHAHDWQTGLAAAYLKFREHRQCRTLFTIHNLQHQGMFSRALLHDLRVPEHAYGLEGLEFHDHISFMKAGLHYSDWLSTVSPTYAKEIQTSEFGHGLEGVLSHRSDRLIGILNGVDYGEWNPATDPHIGHHYDQDTLDGKAHNKAALQKEMGLHVNPTCPLFGVVSRLADQKGLDLVADIIHQLMDSGAQLALLGSGDPELERQFRAAKDANPGQVGVYIGYDEALSHRIQAGSDVFLMPSRFEPCGLTQMYALRYGTVPLVRRTGGLADTVVNLSEDGKEGTGFLFDQADAASLAGAVRALLVAYENPVLWQTMQQRGMKQDFGWSHAAKHYVAHYQNILHGS